MQKHSPRTTFLAAAFAASSATLAVVVSLNASGVTGQLWWDNDVFGDPPEQEPPPELNVSDLDPYVFDGGNFAPGAQQGGGMVETTGTCEGTSDPLQDKDLAESQARGRTQACLYAEQENCLKDKEAIFTPSGSSTITVSSTGGWYWSGWTWNPGWYYAYVGQGSVSWSCKTRNRLKLMRSFDAVKPTQACADLVWPDCGIKGTITPVCPEGQRCIAGKTSCVCN